MLYLITSNFIIFIKNILLVPLIKHRVDITAIALLDCFNRPHPEIITKSWVTMSLYTT